jgi:glycerol-1-phosphate dehydrogenase [NAD(P)+]
LKLRKKDFETAVDMAPLVKTNGYTYIHVKDYREEAKMLINEDAILKKILT